MQLTAKMVEALRLIADTHAAGGRVVSSQTSRPAWQPGGDAFIASGTMAALEARGLITIECSPRHEMDVQDIHLTDEGAAELAVHTGAPA